MTTTALAPTPPVVFLSIGRPLTDAQRDFKLALIDAIKAQGFVPRTVGRGPEDSDHTHVRPVEQIKKVVGESDGAIIVAYEKHFADTLHTNSPAPNPGLMSDVRLPTSWNQAEAAMAYHVGLPLLLISEDNLYGDCLLEDGVIGSVTRIPINQSSIRDSAFQRLMAGWAADVTAFAAERAKQNQLAVDTAAAAKAKDFDAEKLTLADIVHILGSLNWKSALVLIGLLSGLVGAAYTLGASHLLHLP